MERALTDRTTLPEILSLSNSQVKALRRAASGLPRGKRADYLHRVAAACGALPTEQAFLLNLKRCYEEVRNGVPTRRQRSRLARDRDRLPAATNSAPTNPEPGPDERREPWHPMRNPMRQGDREAPAGAPPLSGCPGQAKTHPGPSYGQGEGCDNPPRQAGKQPFPAIMTRAEYRRWVVAQRQPEAPP